MATFTGLVATNNTFTGSAAADTFLWAVADLNSLDHAVGGGGTDALKLTTAGALASTALAGLSGIERFLLAAGGNAVTLVNGNYTGVTGAKIFVTGGAGNDTVNASGLTGKNAIDVAAGAGLDTLNGGAGADVFRFSAADLNGDTVSGGAGRDLLLLTGAGTLAADALGKLAGVETIQLAAGDNGIALMNGNFAGLGGARIVVKGGAGSDVVDATALTGTNALDVTAGAGSDVMRGGAGTDVFRFAAANLAGDTVAGGAGRDQLLLTSGGAPGAGGLNGVAGVETIRLAAEGNTITLANANFAGVAGAKIAVRGGAGNDTVSATGLTGKNAIDVTAGLGADVLSGGTGRDTFRFTVAGLTGDTIDGNGGKDLLLLSDGGTLAAGALAQMDGVETIHLAKAGNAVVLANANFTGVAGAKIAVIGGKGGDTVDGSALTGTDAIDVTAGAGADVLKGGAGADLFRFDPASLAGDTISGGGGADRLLLTRAGTLGSASLVQMTGVETVTFSSGGNGITLKDVNFTGVTGGRISVTGGAGPDRVDASALTALQSVAITAGAGLDQFTGGAGNDRFAFKAADLAGDQVSGGAGTDFLLLASAGTLAATALSHVAGIEQIELAAGGNGITLTDANFAGVSGAITIIGGAGNDTVDGSALTGTRSLDVTAGGGLDTLTGGAAGDTFRFTAADLAGDTVSGGGAYDYLLLQTSGPLAADALRNVSGVDAILLSPGGNQITVTDANFAAPLVGGAFFVIGAAGSSSVNGAGLSAGHILAFLDHGGTDSVVGGAGDDQFQYVGGYKAVAGDRFDGGGGSDKILIDSSMNFLGDTITNVESLLNISGKSIAVSISGQNAARFAEIGSGSLDGVSTVFTVQLSAGGFINLSNLTLAYADAGDAINVVNGGGGVHVTLSAAVTSYTGNDNVGGDYVNDGGGVRAISLGGGDDTIAYYATNPYAAGDTVDGGAGTDAIEIDGSMDFLGDSITNVERLVFAGTSAADITISGENAARFARFVGDFFGASAQTFTVALSAGSSTDLSKLAFENADASDAIKVVSSGGGTSVTLSSSIASFTGSADSDTVSVAAGGHYRTGAVIDGGGGNDRILFDPTVLATLDGGAGNDTLVVRDAANVSLFNSNSQAVGSNTVLNFENVDAGASSAAVTLIGRDDVVSVLIGSGAADTITGGFLGATITGGLGGDTLKGDVGDDRFEYHSTAEASGDTIDGGAGSNGIDVLGVTDLSFTKISNIDTLYLAAGDGAGTFTGDAVMATVTGTQAAGLTSMFGNGYNTTSKETLVVKADTATLDLSGLDFFYFGGPDHVEITGTTGNDTITGTSANDVIHSGGGADTLAGGGGDDVIGYDYFQTSALAGGAANDTIKLESIDSSGSPTSVKVDLTAGTITEFYGASSSFGLSATDFENVDFAANVLDSIIIGTDGDNVLIGGSGIDNFLARLGADTLTGNGGADGFQWNSKLEGGDTITDFKLGTDKLVFAESAFRISGGAFDTKVGDVPGVTENLNSADLFIATVTLNSAAEVRSYVDSENSTASHGMFVVAGNSAGHAVLYYTEEASSSGGTGFDTAFYQIADLGVLPFTQLAVADFVLV